MNMLLLSCTDENYVLPLIVTIDSAVRNLRAGEDVHWVVVLDGVGSDTSIGLKRHGVRLGINLELIDADEIVGFGDLAGTKDDSYLRPATYLRLFADRVMPASADRVLYLDSDLLVRRDLTPLYETNLDGRTIGASRDQLIENRAHCLSGTNARDDRRYFNAGVLLINLDKMRAGLGERLRSHALKLPDAPCRDQDVINDLLEEQDWLELAPEWNVQTPVFRLHIRPAAPWINETTALRQTMAKPAVIHFSGPVKPWDPWSRHPFRRQWRRTLQTSGWLTATEYAQWKTRLYVESAWARSFPVRARLRLRTRVGAVAAALRSRSLR